MSFNTSLRIAALLAALGGAGGAAVVDSVSRPPAADPLRLMPFLRGGGSRGNGTTANHKPGNNLPNLEDRPRNLHRGHTLRRARGPLSYAQHDRLVARWGAREARKIERYAHDRAAEPGVFIERAIHVPAGEQWA